MSVAKKIASLIGGEFIQTAADVVDRFKTTSDEKLEVLKELEKKQKDVEIAVEKTVQTKLASAAQIIEAEMNQGDNYTKRARPTVVYAGLFMIFVNYVMVPAIGDQANDLPEQFWWTWGGVVGIWSAGRSIEKRGIKNKATKAISGNGSLEERLKNQLGI